MNPHAKRNKYAHTRYTFRTRTRKKCTRTRRRIGHIYGKYFAPMGAVIIKKLEFKN